MEDNEEAGVDHGGTLKKRFLTAYLKLVLACVHIHFTLYIQLWLVTDVSTFRFIGFECHW